MPTANDKLRDRMQKPEKDKIARDALHADDVMGGVSASWLAQALGIPSQTVREKLRGCVVKRRIVRAGRPSPMYDLRDAMSRLVPPQLNSRDYIRALKRNDLPPALSQQLWDGILKRQKAEVEAGQLWRTDDIRDVLANTFQTMKFEIQLWLETMERNTELSDRQREVIVQLSRALQNSLYDALVQNEKLGNTGPVLDKLLERLGEATPINELLNEPDPLDDLNPVEVEVEDDDWTDLV